MQVSATELVCSLRRLEQLDGIAVGVLQLDLFASRTHFHLIAKVNAGILQFLDTGFKTFDSQDDAIPSSGFLALTAGH